MIEFFTSFWLIWLIGAVIWMFLSMLPAGDSAGVTILRVVLLFVAIIVAAVTAIIARVRVGGVSIILPWWSTFIYILLIFVCFGWNVGTSYALAEDEAGYLYIVRTANGMFVYLAATLLTVFYFMNVTWASSFGSATPAEESSGVSSLISLILPSY